VASSSTSINPVSPFAVCMSHLLFGTFTTIS